MSRSSKPQIHWRAAGHGPALVLINGWTASGLAWPSGWVRELQQTYRVVRPDNRGTGYSRFAEVPFTIGDMAEDVVDVLDDAGIEHASVLGLSMGGMIGQTAALKYPGIFRSMTLADTTSRYPAEAAAMWQERIRVAESKGMEPLVQGTLERWFTESFRKNQPEKVKSVAALIRNTPVPGYVGCCAAIPKINVTSRLKEIKTPTLVICGENDPGTPPAMAREIQENIPGAKLALIPQAAHLANIEQPEAFNRALGEFLSSPASARP
jgi:3-oxoadipate enol-lactonase